LQGERWPPANDDVRPFRSDQEEAMSFVTTPLHICAHSTGGAAVTLTATLYVDDLTSSEAWGTLTRIDRKRQCMDVQAHTEPGALELELICAAGPLLGNSDYVVRVTIEHPDLPQGGFDFVAFKGNAGAGLVSRTQTFVLN
jgi:hypothetical protein